MINIKNFDKIKERYTQYWDKENHDRPLMDITALKYGYQKDIPTYSGSLYDRWNDIDYVIKKERAVFRGTYYEGEAYPNTYPNLGPDVFGAYFGCDIEFGEDTSWAKNHCKKLEELKELKVDWNNKWLTQTVNMTRTLLEDSKGDYLVGITDLHPGMDGLVSLRGPEELCFDLFEEPEKVKKLNHQMFECFKEIYGKLEQIIAVKQKGISNWMGVYHPHGWYVTSCDFMGMISEEMYSEFVDHEIRGEVAFLKNSIFHLDGPDALRHLDNILKIEEIKGIQWVYGAGQPTASYWVEILKKIQEAGKMIHIDIVMNDLPILLENIRPEGVLYRMRCDNIEEAKYALSLAEKSYIKKNY